MLFVAWKPGGNDAKLLKEKRNGQPEARTTTQFDEQAFAIIQTRCAICHSAHPSDFVNAPPGGVEYDTPVLIHHYAAQIRAQAVDSNAMPPGNLTGMTDEERAALGVWAEKTLMNDTP
jgi:uncharacterized membrane protein